MGLQIIFIIHVCEVNKRWSKTMMMTKFQDMLELVNWEKIDQPELSPNSQYRDLVS